MKSRNAENNLSGKIISRTFLLLVGVMLVVQTGIAQQRTATVLPSRVESRRPVVSVNFKNQSLPDALHTLARKVQVGISYKTDILPAKLVTYRAQNADVYVVLDAILRGTDLYASLSANRKVIMIKKRVLPRFAKVQSTVTGTVTDAKTGKTLPGVNIVVQGTQTGTSTNAKGHYELSVESLQDTLAFSFLGYATKKVPINGQTNIDVDLKSSTLGLKQLVVSGYATSERQENEATSVTKINADELTGGTTPATTGGALEGKVVGANIISTGGAPGGGIDFKLRGISTLGAGRSQPLIIVDGVQINNNELQTGVSAVSAQQADNQDDSAGRLADLNPNDIESIQVLKGPSAAAIYGVRANAGVVIIKTKRGHKGATKVEFTQEAGFSSILRKLDRPSFSINKINLLYGEGSPLGNTATKLFNEAQANNNFHDYQDLLFGNKGSRINDELKVSGGNDKTQFLVSGEIKRNNGIIKNTGFNRYSVRANIDHQFGRDITVHSSSNYINSQTDRGFTGNGGVGSVIQALYAIPPFAQLLPDDQGNYPTNPFFQTNPFQLIKFGVNHGGVNRLLQSLSTNIGIYNGGRYHLNLKVNGGLDFLNSDHQAYMPRFLQFQQTQPNPGDVINSLERDLNVNLKAFLVAKTTVGPEESPWDLTSQIGYTTFHQEVNLEQVRGRGLVPGQRNIENASVQEVYNEFFENVTDIGFAGQQRINWGDKVIGTAGLRLDKSTLNQNQNKFYLFPKGSVAINLTNFDFWGNQPVSQFKLRAAYGETGGLPNFGVTFNALTSGNISGNLGTFRSTRTIDPNLRPETSREIEFGTDIGFLKNRLSVNFTYYIKDVNDLILDEQLPASSGLQVQATNGADLRNRGIELSLNFIPLQSRNISWNSRINFSRNIAKITKLNVPPFTTGGFGPALGTFYRAVGFSPTTIVGTPFNQKEGRFTIYGDTQPDFNLSLNNNLNFLNSWKLGFLWQLKYGQKEIDIARLLQDAGGTTPDWNEDFNNNGIPNGLDRKGTGAGRYIKDATFLKLREISLYYTVPNSFLNAFAGNAVQNIRFGVSANNVLLFSSYPGYDPETSEFGNSATQTGISIAPYPTARDIMFHVKFDF